jgi:HD superfamily phosphodiesterase
LTQGIGWTIEEKIVWDADKIDLLGIIGIVRAFHWLGSTAL